MELPYDPVIPLLGMYPESPESPIQRKLCTPLFISALFTIAKCWKLPKFPSVGEWIKKLVYLHNGILHSRKKEGIPTFCKSTDGTGTIMLRDISQLMKDTCHMISLIRGI